MLFFCCENSGSYYCYDNPAALENVIKQVSYWRTWWVSTSHKHNCLQYTIIFTFSVIWVEHGVPSVVVWPSVSWVGEINYGLIVAASSSFTGWRSNLTPTNKDNWPWKASEGRGSSSMQYSHVCWHSLLVTWSLISEQLIANLLSGEEEEEEFVFSLLIFIFWMT